MKIGLGRLGCDRDVLGYALRLGRLRVRCGDAESERDGRNCDVRSGPMLHGGSLVSFLLVGHARLVPGVTFCFVSTKGRGWPGIGDQKRRRASDRYAQL